MYPFVVFVVALFIALSIVAMRSRSDGWSTFGFMGFALGGIALLLVVLSAFRIGSTNGDGLSVGTIVNVGNEGFWWSVPTVHLLHRGEMKADEFGIDRALVNEAIRLSESGDRVRVHYISSPVCGAWNSITCDVIDRIEIEK